MACTGAVVGRASVGLRPASEVAVAAEDVTEAAVAPTAATEPQVVAASAASVDPAAAASAAVDPVVGVVPDIWHRCRWGCPRCRSGSTIRSHVGRYVQWWPTV